MQVLNSEVVTLTTELAEKLLKLNNYKHQRALRHGHVSFLAKEMSLGHFSQANIGLAQLVSGEQFVVNGQHTLNAVKRSGVQLNNIIITRYLVDNYEDLAFLYRTIDRNLSRGVADALETSELRESLGMVKTQLTFLASAIKVLFEMKNGKPATNSGNYGSGKVSDTELVESIKKYHKTFVIYESIVKGCSLPRNIPYRTEVLALALLTLEYSEENATMFWKGVLHDDGLGKLDIRKKANRFLLTSKSNGGGVVSGITRSESLLNLVGFWNKWNKAKPSVEDDKLPIALTPIVLNIPKKLKQK